MTTTTKSFLMHSVLAFAVLCVSASVVDAGNVSFEDIMQSTQTPDDPDNLYGEPDTSTSDKLSFRPVSFAATATGAGGVDVTDGFLSFTVKSAPGTWSTGFNLMESGSWSLIPDSAGNSAGVRGNGAIRITEVNGQPVAGPSFPILYLDDFDQSDTPPDSDNWDLTFSQGFGSVDGRVTEFKVELNNRLFALSQAGFSFVDKKNIMITVDTEIPEPTTLLMASLALAVSLGRRRMVV